jgi:hypothetical protein
MYDMYLNILCVLLQHLGVNIHGQIDNLHVMAKIVIVQHSNDTHPNGFVMKRHQHTIYDMGGERLLDIYENVW